MKFLNDLTLNHQTDIDFITSTGETRKLFWDDRDRTLSMELGNGVVHQIGQEQNYLVKNLTPFDIPNGTLVMTTGSTGEAGRLTIALATGSSSIDAQTIMGFTTETILAGEDGFVTSFGLVRNIDTSGILVSENWIQGDKLYIHPTIPGALTKIMPEAPNLKVLVGRVAFSDSVQGSLFVRVYIGSYLGSDHNVQFVDLQDKDMMFYNDIIGRWENIHLDDLRFKASQSLLTDLGSYYDSDNVENALQEVGAEFTEVTKKLINTMSTGVIEFGGLAKVDATRFNVGAVVGYIVDNETNPNNPTVTKVTYAGATNLTTPYLNTDPITHIFINNLSQLVMLPGGNPTDEQERTMIYLGRVAHPTLTEISTAGNTTHVAISPTSQLRDLWNAIGIINNGNFVYPHNGDLTLSFNGGSLYTNGINFYSNPYQPNRLDIPSEVILTFGYRTRTGVGANGYTSMVTNYYDVGGTPTLIPANNQQATNQYVYLASSGIVLIQYGQHLYSKLDDAYNAVGKESFVTHPNLLENAILIGIITVRVTATDLSLPTHAKFTAMSKFGQLVAGGGGAGAVNAEYVAIADGGNYFTSSNVEGALQEVGYSINNMVTVDSKSIVEVGTGLDVSSAVVGDTTTYTVSHEDTSTLNGIIGTNGIASMTVDPMGHVTAATTATFLTSESPDFRSVLVTDTDSGFVWSQTGSAVASINGDTLTVVSGAGVNVDVSPDADAIRISNSGVTSVAAGLGIDVSTNTGNTTISHADTSSATNLTIDNSNGNVIQDLNVTVDTYGHVTAVTAQSYDLDNRYYTETEVNGKLDLKVDNTELVNYQEVFNGVNNSNLFNVTYSHATRQFTVVYSSGALVYVNGKAYPKSGSETTVAHAIQSRKWYLYYNNIGELVVTSAPWDINTSAQLALVYYSITKGASIHFVETHPGGKDSMSTATHAYMHTFFGTQHLSGLGVSGYTAPSTNVLSQIQYAVADGVIADEDLTHTVLGFAKGSSMRIMYRAANGDWTWDDTSTTGILHNGTNAYINTFTGGTWQLTPQASNNIWFNYYLVAVPNADMSKRVSAVMGQTPFASEGEALSSDPDINIVGWSEFTSEHVFFTRLTYRRTVSSNTFNTTLVAVQQIRSNNVSITGATPTDHQGLTNRYATGAHPATAIEITPVATLTSTNVQTALGEISPRLVPSGGTAGQVLAKIDSTDYNDQWVAANAHNHDLLYTPIAHVGTGGTSHAAVTTSVNGFMTSTDKTKLDGIAINANNYSHPTGFENAPTTALAGASVISQISVNANGHVTGITPRNITSTDIGATPATHIGSTGTAHGVATTSVNGFMASTDKSKLDGIASGAEVNVNADWNAVSGDAQILNKPTLGTSASRNTGIIEGTVPLIGAGGKIDASILPSIAITETFVVATQAAMLALVAQLGDVAVRTDLNKSFILRVEPATILANWQELLSPTDSVLSVNSKTGTVVLTAADVGASPTSHDHNKFLNMSDGTNVAVADSASDTFTFAQSGGLSVLIDAINDKVTYENTDKGSSQLIFKNVTDGANTAVADSNNDTLTFAVGQIDLTSGLSVVVDPATDKVTYTHANTSSQASVDNVGRTYIQDITLDTYGHITGIQSATESVVDTNTTYGISAETVTGGANLRLGGNDASIDDVKFASGSNVSITRTDASTITISSTDTNTTYSVFNTTTDGLVPKTTTSNTADYLRRDGTWATPPNTVYTHPTYSYTAPVVGTGTIISSIPFLSTLTETNGHITGGTMRKLVAGTNVSIVAATNGDITFSAQDTNTTYTAGNGIDLTSTTFSLGTPSTLTTSTTNATTASSHTHAVTFPVTSVAGRTGGVILTSTDVGLNNVTNDAQVKKAISSTNGYVPVWSGTTGDVLGAGYSVQTVLSSSASALVRADAIQTAMNLKANLASPTFTGTVSGITATMVGLGSVDNTSDAAKPVSTAQQTALNLKANLASPTFTGTVGGITKDMVGLSNVDNTSDASKPVSTAQQTALNLKANLASPTFTGTVSGITATMVGLGNVTNESKATMFASPTFTGTVSGVTKTMVGLGSVDNTADSAKPVSTAQQTALNLKANLNSPALTGTPTAPTATSGTNTTQVATTEYVQSELANVSVPNLTLNELTLGGRFKLVYNITTDSLDIEVI